MSLRTFTLKESLLLLPVLKALLARAMTAKRLIETIDQEFEDLSHKILLMGGMLLNVPKLARRRAERDHAIQQIKDAVSEIHSTGVQVKDLDTGLLDFPCIVDGETILLCWKFGEETITHWHGLEEGFAGRKPITANIANPRKPNQRQ